MSFEEPVKDYHGKLPAIALEIMAPFIRYVQEEKWVQGIWAQNSYFCQILIDTGRIVACEGHNYVELRCPEIESSECIQIHVPGNLLEKSMVQFTETFEENNTVLMEQMPSPRQIYLNDGFAILLGTTHRQTRKKGYLNVPLGSYFSPIGNVIGDEYRALKPTVPVSDLASSAQKLMQCKARSGPAYFPGFILELLGALTRPLNRLCSKPLELTLKHDGDKSFWHLSNGDNFDALVAAECPIPR